MPRRRPVPQGNATNNRSSDRSVIANAHAMVAIACVVSSPVRLTACSEMARMNSGASALALAYAQSVMDSDCSLKSYSDWPATHARWQWSGV